MARISSKESNTSSRLSSRAAELMISLTIAEHISETSLLAMSAALRAARACIGRVKLWWKNIDLRRASLAVEGGRAGWTKNRPFLDQKKGYVKEKTKKQTIFRPKEGDKKKGAYIYCGVGCTSARRLEEWSLCMGMC